MQKGRRFFVSPCCIWWPLLDLNQRPSDYEFLTEQPKINSLRYLSLTYIAIVCQLLPIIRHFYRHFIAIQNQSYLSKLVFIMVKRNDASLEVVVFFD